MKKVLLVDDNSDMCELMGDLFEALDVEQFTYAISYIEMTKLVDVLSNDIILLDINLGSDVPDGIDCYNFLEKAGYKGKVVFFTGHAQSHPLVLKAMKIPNVYLLQKPAEVSEIAKLLN